MNITVRYFASVREARGCSSESLATQAATLAALREELVARGGAGAQALAANRAVRMALDQVMADDTAPLRDGCEVAFFPPVTGG
jgi:sulfur-carrier protein